MATELKVAGKNGNVQSDDGDFKPSPREALHTDPQLCKDLSRKIVSTVPLEIRSSQISMGSGLFAGAAVNEGREIYRSTPLMAAIDTGNETFCHYCLKDTFDDFGATTPSEPKTLAKACAACKVARFCSKKCQKAAWAQFHKDECKTLLAVPKMKAYDLLVHRLVFWQLRKFVTTVQGKAIDFLESHFNEYMNSAKRSTEITDIALDIRKSTGNKASMALLWKLVPALRVNCVRIRTAGQLEPIGYALDLVTSVINHSCHPNAHVFFEGRELRVRSLKKIAPGEEITICYLDPRACLASRLEFLEREHFFKCRCKRCKYDLTEQFLMVDPQKLATCAMRHAIIEMINLMTRTFLAVNHPELYPDLKNLGAVEIQLRTIAGRVLPPGASWPDHMEPLPMARQSLATLYISQGKPGPALRNALKGVLMTNRWGGASEWVNEMVDMIGGVMIASACLLPSDDTSAVASKALPDTEDIQVVTFAYLCEMCRLAAKAFGGGAEFTKGVCAMFGVLVKKMPDLKPGTKDYSERFEAAQGRLMEWAGIPAKHAIVLSS